MTQDVEPAPDRPEHHDEVEVTSEMIEAGKDALYGIVEVCANSDAELTAALTETFSAMLRARDECRR